MKQPQGPTDEQLIELGRSAIEGYIRDRPDEAREKGTDRLYATLDEDERNRMCREWGNLIYGINERRAQLSSPDS